MVTIFTYNPQFGEDRCTRFRVIVVTDPQTNPQTDSGDYNTLSHSLARSVSEFICWHRTMSPFTISDLETERVYSYNLGACTGLDSRWPGVCAITDCTVLSQHIAPPLLWDTCKDSNVPSMPHWRQTVRCPAILVVAVAHLE